ncbi:hypothetical protein ABNX05_18265 [Lysinibacillus sp. M3]|uniref:Uncharacterized protein n=1 Tax=Lysinibacillus zambalensis TaxID=3160866 RepID=A0ABV1MVP4_9BACI
MSRHSTTGYLSSNGFEATTKPMQEIIPPPPSNWSIGYTFEKFSFYNETACSVIINKKYPITLSAGRGFEVGYDDVPIESFVIVEAQTPYEFIASF